MESEELYQLKSIFYQANYKTVIDTPLPNVDSSSYLPSLVYNLRAHLALAPSKPLPTTSESTSHAYRAVASFASYLQDEDKSEALDELREIIIEAEAEEEIGWEEGVVRALSATAFLLEGEVEEALDTLASDTAKRDLECVALMAQIQLSLNRADLAQKTLESAKKWADDALLLQLVEAWVGMRTIPPNYTSSYYTFLELTTVPNPSATLLTNRAIAQLCQGNIPEAEGSLAEALEKDPNSSEALALKARFEKGDAVLGRLKQIAPAHPILKELEAKASAFDEAAAKWAVPPLATASA